MTKKFQFYDRHGVEEYYIYDPDRNDLNGLYRLDNSLSVIEDFQAWTSPRLQIKFVINEDRLEIYLPDSQKFLTTIELNQRANQECDRADREHERAERLLAQSKEFC